MNWTACKVVVLDRPTLPPRSRLYSLRPLGIGTSEVESLTGYIARLAKAHYVSAGTLLGKELVGRLDKIPKIRGIPGIPTYLRSINGVTPFAASMVRAVESSTHRSDLRSLTMLAWANVLPSKGLLRSHRAWCPDCLGEHATVYEPLLWCVGAVEVCPRHGRPLTSRCPHCSETLPVLGWHTWPGQCSECLGYLHDDSVRSASENVAPFHQLWTANTVGEMLVGSQDEPIPRERLMEALRFWTPSGTTVTTASLLEKNGATVRTWLTGRRLPKLGTLLEICHKLETSPLPFFNLAQPAPRSQRTATPCAQAKRPKKSTPRRKLKLTELRVKLESALRNEGVRPPSTKEVIRHLGHAKATLYRHFPELCRAISMAHMAWRVECGVRRRQVLVEEVRKVAASLHEVGREPTLREVASRMTKPGSFRDPIARVALVQIRLELGPVPAWAVVLRSVENAEA